MNRVVLRGTVTILVVGTFITAGALGATAIRGRGDKRTDSAATKALPEQQPIAHEVTAPTDTAVVVKSASVAKPAGVPARAPGAHPPLVPIVPAGNSDLQNGITATRNDSAVVVSFDLPMARTRMPDRFERLLRATLPSVYGAPAAAVLTALPAGSLAAQGDLLTELPARGVRIPVNQEWEIRVYPETRPGHDGPLVIRYRALLTPASE